MKKRLQTEVESGENTRLERRRSTDSGECDLRLKLRAARFWGLSRRDLETEVESQRRHEFDEPDPVTNAVNPFKEVLTERRKRKGRKKVINGQVRD
ncbi:unnamed protein product [Brassica oleracea]